MKTKTLLQAAIDKINQQNEEIKKIKTKGKDPVKVLNQIRQQN